MLAFLSKELDRQRLLIRSHEMVARYSRGWEHIVAPVISTLLVSRSVSPGTSDSISLSVLAMSYQLDLFG